MPRIIVETEGQDREVVFWEHVGTEDFEGEHFRRCLADRVSWAVADATEAEEQAQKRLTQTTAAPLVSVS